MEYLKIFKLKLLLATIITFLVVGLSLSEANDPPNIIFILTDDESMGYLGVTGNDIVHTPNIDKLAEEGTFFKNAYVTSAICTPSRASIFLSQFERKHGINFNSVTSMSPEAWANSYPMVLQNNGYYTGYIGKNHVPIGEDGYQTGFIEESFDYWYAAHGHLTFYPKRNHDIFDGASNDTQVEILGEAAEEFLGGNEYKLDRAIHFLDERPQDQPFVLSISFNLPHSAGTRSMEQLPDDPEIYKSLYRDIEIPLPDHYIAKDDIIEPKLPPDLLRTEDRQTSYDFVDKPETVIEREIRKMQSMTGIDQLIGKLRNQLKELDIDDNTVIIYTSDHGLFMGQFGLGGKALCYQQVTHVPMIIYNPLIDPNNRVTTSEALVQTIDIAPTMLSLAGINRPETYQGEDLTGLLDGRQNNVRDYIFTENLWSTAYGNPRCEAVQCKDWKYIRYYENNNMSALRMIEEAEKLGVNANVLSMDNQLQKYRSYIYGPLEGEEPVYEELYHLAEDPDEVNNIVSYTKHRSVLNKLRYQWEEKIQYARGESAPMVLPLRHR